jgi:leader peptidase (prepilin peptidase)/N-methyltransferase
LELFSTLFLAVSAGAFAGTLINVVATRLPADGDPSIVGYPLRPVSGQPDALALIPYAGAWQPMTRGIDWPKLSTDVAAAVIAGIALARYGFSFEGMQALVYALILLLIMRIDWQNHLIFTITIVPGILAALGFQAIDSFDALARAAAAALIAAAVFCALYIAALAIYKRRALGAGDIWLAALIGAMTGAQAIGAILLGMILAGVGGLLLIAIRVRSKDDFIPYGAYLCLGAIIVVL